MPPCTGWGGAWGVIEVEVSWGNDGDRDNSQGTKTAISEF
jgi:hypothetical protein